MSLPDEWKAKRPDFPWLEDGALEAVQTLMQAEGWLDPGEQVESCARAGEGNMNLTLRVVTNRRSVILKQARPWVEKYNFIPAPWDRAIAEFRFYERASRIPPVRDRMPQLHAASAAYRCLLLEDLGEASDLTSIYGGAPIAAEEIRTLGAFIATLHQASRGMPDPAFANLDMRALNHEHIFRVPLLHNNGVDLEALEPGLTTVAESLRKDTLYQSLSEQTGHRYLADGPCLLHGDFFPGSWLRTPSGIRVIDPEFCFYGDPEFDVAIALAHFCLADRPRTDATLLLESYGSALPLDEGWIASYAAAEVMRRLLGVAQLPIAPSCGFRAQRLHAARRAMLTKDWRLLWTLD
ncbi:MAG: phosphotransferase [Candidatus Hydrogenedens sp.]|nr:phosphotransferase [Candidatus Hydrogenedens sp.]